MDLRDDRSLCSALFCVVYGLVAERSVFSLSIVIPVVACYLIYDWKRMVAVIDNWVPPVQRDTVRILAREIDDTIGGFVIGQGALCLILVLFYAVALSLIDLKHGLLIGRAAGLISFIPVSARSPASWYRCALRSNSSGRIGPPF